MSKHVVLLKFTEKGIADIKDSAQRAEDVKGLAVGLADTVGRFRLRA